MKIPGLKKSKPLKEIVKATSVQTTPYAHPLEQVAEMVAADMQARMGVAEAEDADPPVLGWLVSERVVYCAKCVNATSAQRDRWRPLYVGRRWPAACQICGEYSA